MGDGVNLYCVCVVHCLCHDLVDTTFAWIYTCEIFNLIPRSAGKKSISVERHSESSSWSISVLEPRFLEDYQSAFLGCYSLKNDLINILVFWVFFKGLLSYPCEFGSVGSVLWQLDLSFESIYFCESISVWMLFSDCDLHVGLRNCLGSNLLWF